MEWGGIRRCREDMEGAYHFIVRLCSCFALAVSSKYRGSDLVH